MLNPKYTDEDVRRSETLYLCALKFLRQYQGDFQFLAEAKNHLEYYHDLPVPTARGVLNCMRVNPEGAMMLPQTGDGRYHDGIRHSGSNLFIPNGHLRRPAHIDLKSTWHVQYVLSTWPTAQVFHVLRPELSYIRWYPHQDRFGYNIEVWCGYPIGWSYNSTYIMTNDKRDRRICKGCDRRMQAYAQEG